MSKILLYGKEGRDSVAKGINIVADAIAPTLGAMGKSVIIDMGHLDPIVADDGGIILRSMELKNREAQLGSRFLRKIGLKMHNKTGDGRSTAVTLARALLNESLREIGHDSAKIPEVQARLNRGLNQTLGMLELMKRTIMTDDQIVSIATIASLDPEVGRIIGECFSKVGRDGVVTVEESAIVGISSEVVKGMRIPKGLSTSHFINEPDKERCVLNAPHILIADRRIATNSQIKNWLGEIIKSPSKDVLIVALDVEGEALASLVMNHQRKALQVACVQAPYTGQRQKDFLKDLAILTGGTVVSEEAGLTLDTAGMSVLGQAEKVIVDNGETMIINGNGKKEEIENRLIALKELLKTKESEGDKTIIQGRIAALTGGVGVIRIGAFTDTELKKRKDKISDAINSTKLALEEGIVIGGGAPFAKIAGQIDDPIFARALTAPFELMAKNAGVFDRRNWLEKIFARIFRIEPTTYDALWDVQVSGEQEGYDFKQKKLMNLMDAGIIDPFKVERIALESAVSIVSQVISSDVVMVEYPEDKVPYNDGRES